MRVTIEIKDGLAGYQFKDGNDNVVQFENLSRWEQVRILNGFANGYTLFKSVLKDKGGISMTKGELKDKLTQICKEYVEANGGDVHGIIFSVGIYPDHESPQLKVIRYTSFNPNHIIA